MNNKTPTSENSRQLRARDCQTAVTASGSAQAIMRQVIRPTLAKYDTSRTRYGTSDISLHEALAAGSDPPPERLSGQTTPAEARMQARPGHRRHSPVIPVCSPISANSAGGPARMPGMWRHSPVARIRRLIAPFADSSAIGTIGAARLLESKRYNTISASYDVTHALLAFDSQKFLAEPAKNHSHHRQHWHFHVFAGRHGGHVPRVLPQRPHAAAGPASGGPQPHLLHRVDAPFLRSGDSTRAGCAPGDGLAMVRRRL